MKSAKARAYFLAFVAALLILAAFIYAFWGSAPNIPPAKIPTANITHNEPVEKENATLVANEAKPKAISFGKITPYNEGHVYKLAWGDANNDGLLDLAIANYNRDNYLFINSNGTFQKSPQFGSGYSVNLKWADLDKDGNQDVIVLRYNEKSSIYFNNGDGTFTESKSFREGYAKAMAVDDFNNDGYLDVFVGYDSENNYVYFNDQKRGFTEIKIDNFGPLHITASDSCDLDNDGLKDIVAGTDFQQNYILINDGDSTFTVSPAFGSMAHTRAIICRDLNIDGKDDVIVGNDKEASNEEKNYIYFNNGNFDFTASPEIGAYTTYAIDTGDFNGDGMPDVVVGNYNEESYIFLNKGNGQFEKAAAIEKNYVRDIKAVDLDGDGLSDISRALDKNGLEILLNEASKA